VPNFGGLNPRTPHLHTHLAACTAGCRRVRHSYSYINLVGYPSSRSYSPEHIIIAAIQITVAHTDVQLNRQTWQCAILSEHGIGTHRNGGTVDCVSLSLPPVNRSHNTETTVFNAIDYDETRHCKFIVHHRHASQYAGNR